MENERNNLIKQIQNNTNRVQQREQNGFVSVVYDPHYKKIVQEVYDENLKKLIDLNKKGSYTKTLQEIKDTFFQNLKSQFKEDLSTRNIKYCLCFAIGMSTEDIAECFGVEPRSVYTIRHRLKSKLNMDEASDLNLFLRHLND